MNKPTNNPGTRPLAGGSLLDEDVVVAEPAAPARPSWWRRVSSLTPGAVVSAAGGLVRRRPRAVGAVCAVLVAGGAAGAWLSLRVQPPPDYETERLDTLFEYTLLTDDFNRLPVEQRLELLGKLVQRMRAMTSGDSLLLAMFASMIAGEARAQLEENISRLAIDVADKFAVDYDATAPAEERQQFLEDAFVELQEMGGLLTGELSEKSREEMLDDGARQAKRDLRRFEQGRVGADEVIRVFDVMNNGIGQHMSGHQKLRVSAMFRDMTEMLRQRP